MNISLRIIFTVLALWSVAGLVFVFGFRLINWTGWAGGLPWAAGVVALFWGVTQVSRALIQRA